jgi:hypothetical protein
LSQELRGLVAGIDDPLRLAYLLSSLPARNEPDLAELPPEVQDGMRFVPVQTLQEVLEIALPQPATAALCNS